MEAAQGNLETCWKVKVNHERGKDGGEEMQSSEWEGGEGGSDPWRWAGMGQCRGNNCPGPRLGSEVRRAGV